MVLADTMLVVVTFSISAHTILKSEMFRYHLTAVKVFPSYFIDTHTHNFVFNIT